MTQALPAIIREFRGLGLDIRLLTNGYEISDELMTELRQCDGYEVVLSIKTLNEGMHIKYQVSLSSPSSVIYVGYTMRVSG